MGCMDEHERRAAANFLDNNRIRFDVPVDDQAKAWWAAQFDVPFGLSPENVGDLLSNSWSADKRMVVIELNGVTQRFAVRVEGAWGREEFWFHARTLDLRGSVANADRMFISEKRQGQGFGRRFMGDLIATARLLGLSRIALDAEHIGRYAWLRVGFLPDRGSWMTIGIEIQHRLAAALPDLGSDRFLEILTIARSPDRTAARELAAISDEVSSREMFNPDGTAQRVSLGKALFLEIGSNWSGDLDLADEASMLLADSYVQGGA